MECAKFNNRLQITELELGTSATDGSLWKVNYDYGEIDANGTHHASRNTGNIAKQTISFNGLSAPFIQTYRYDALDRLVEAKETNGGTQMWYQGFGYDRYGNRTNLTQVIGTEQLALNQITLPSVSAATNRFTAQNYEYDLNGNLIKDAQGRQFTFNGDNKQVEVKNSANQTIGTYFYDADGKRVKKVVGNETTVFVYSGGKLVAEYASQVPPNQTPQISYTTADVLGSPRVITNQAGGVTSRRDFMPFGEDLIGANVLRDGAIYSADTIRKKFTGYEKDIETGLDFAEARYYNNFHGRFTAVDPLMASGKSTDPQTFNRYIYCGANPISCVDSTGLDGFWAYRDVKRDDGQIGRAFSYFQSQSHMDFQNLFKTEPYQRWTGPNYYLFGDKDRTVMHLGQSGFSHTFSALPLWTEEKFSELVNAQESGRGLSVAQLGTLDIDLGLQQTFGFVQTYKNGKPYEIRAGTVSPIRGLLPAAGGTSASNILTVQRQISLETTKQAAVTDRWLRMSNSRLATSYRGYQSSDPNFASMIRGRVIDRRMNSFFHKEFGSYPGVRIDQAIPGSGIPGRPDLYFPNLQGSRVIFDVGGPSKINGIRKYDNVADFLFPIIH